MTIISRNNPYTFFLQNASDSTLNRVDRSANWISQSPSTRASLKAGCGAVAGFVGGHLGSYLGRIIGSSMQPDSPWDDRVQYNYSVMGSYYGFILGSQVGGAIGLALSSEFVDSAITNVQKKCASQWLENALYKGYFRQVGPLNSKTGAMIVYESKNSSPNPREYYQNRRYQNLFPEAGMFLSLGITCSPCSSFAVLYDPILRFIFINDKTTQTTRYWDPEGEKVYMTEKVGVVRKVYLNKPIPDVTGKQTPYTESLHFNPQTQELRQTTQVLDKKIISEAISTKNMGFSSGKMLCFVDEDSGVQIVVDKKGKKPKTVVFCDVGKKLFLYEDLALKEVIANSGEYNQLIFQYFNPAN